MLGREGFYVVRSQVVDSPNVDFVGDSVVPWIVVAQSLGGVVYDRLSRHELKAG